MKLTKSQLKRIIKEELENVVGDSGFGRLQKLAHNFPILDSMLDNFNKHPKDREHGYKYWSWGVVEKTLRGLEESGIDLKRALIRDQLGTVNNIARLALNKIIPDEFKRRISAEVDAAIEHGHGVKIE